MTLPSTEDSDGNAALAGGITNTFTVSRTPVPEPATVTLLAHWHHLGCCGPAAAVQL